MATKKTCDQHWKMAHRPVLKHYVMPTLVGVLPCERSMPMASEDGSEAYAKVIQRPLAKPQLRRILRLPAGSPCPCLNSTMPSWPQTSRPSSWRSPHHNRTAQKKSRNHHPGLGTPFHEPYSTTPSLLQTSPPASLRIHRCSCKDLRAAAAASAAQVGGWAAAAERSARIHGDGYGNTSLSCPLPSSPPHQQRN